MEEGLVSDFLRASGHADAVETVQLLLLSATIRLTQDLRDLSAVAACPLTRRAVCYELVHLIGRRIRLLGAQQGQGGAALPETEVCVCGSIAAKTDLDDAVVDIVLSHGDPCAKLYENATHSSRRQLKRQKYCLLEIIPGAVTIRVESASPMVSLLNDVRLRDDICALMKSRMMISLYHPLRRPIEIKLLANRQNAVDVAKSLGDYFEANSMVRPVILFLKVWLKQLHIPSSQLTPYVLTLMVVAFARYHAHVFPFSPQAHYPHGHSSVDSGRLLLAFLSFFSPLPKGKFDEQYMRLVPANPQGIVFVKDAVSSSLFSLSKHREAGKERVWSVMEPTANGLNAAAECTSIHECRLMFEEILRRLLNNYTDGCCLFPGANSGDEMDQSRDHKRHLIPLLLEDWWASRRKGST